MEIKHHLVIMLPEEMAELPIVVVKSQGLKKIVLRLN